MNTQTPQVTAEQEQTTLLDLSGREVYADFFDDKTPVFLPKNPLHFKAHKLQILVSNLEKQAVKNAAQFNSKNYLDAVDALMKCYEEIRQVADEQLHDTRAVGSESTGQENPGALGDGASHGVDSRISADNPFAGPRVDTSSALPVPG